MQKVLGHLLEIERILVSLINTVQMKLPKVMISIPVSIWSQHLDEDRYFCLIEWSDVHSGLIGNEEQVSCVSDVYLRQADADQIF